MAGASSSADGAATSSMGSGGTPVTKWNFVKVPKTASVKMKNKGVCEPDPTTVLSLHASIYCATNPNYTNKRVPCCDACQTREKKRNLKKNLPTSTAASNKGSKSSGPSNVPSKNPTPATSDAEVYGSQPPSAHPSGSFWGGHHHQQQQVTPNGSGGSDDMETDDYISPVDFTCYQMVDFTTGSAQLSFRIVCYCRHYREKVGFCVLLTLKDNFGRVVGEVRTSPIMITDDHKSVQKLTPAHTADEEEADSHNASTRRRAKRIVGERIKHEEIDEQDENMNGVGAIRNKRSSRISGLSRSSTGISKFTSASSAPISAASTSGNMSGTSAASASGPRPTIATTTNVYDRRESQSGYAHRSNQSQSYTQSESPLATTAPSSPSVGLSPPSTGFGADGGGKNEMDTGGWNPFPLFSSTGAAFQETGMNTALPIMPMATMSIGSQIAPSMPPPPPPPLNPYPHITRVIPSSGSILGGIEVTLFGANFSRESLANAGIAFGRNVVMFGDGMNGVAAAQVWSETVLICTLPPSPLPGSVPVSLVGVPTSPVPPDGPPPIFTYTEEGDKVLMMQALQMLGWQNSGQWQDPTSVAMNIITNNTQPQGMMIMEDPTGSDFSSLLRGMSSGNVADGKGKTTTPRQPPSKLEGLVLNVLRSAQHPVTGIIGRISTPDPITGQTLLHIASALGYHRLVRALIGWGAKVDVQDKNGFSPAHFACFYGRLECLDDLVRIGRAHLEGQDIQGRFPSDVCGTDKVKVLVSELEEEVETRRRRSRAPSEIESGGDADDEGILWSSEADDDDEEEDVRPAKFVGAEQPQPVSRRISRVNSVASIASNHRISRSTTPFASEPMMTPVTPLHSSPSSAAALAPSTTWGLPRNIPMPNIAMPWPVQLPAGWQLPNVPQFTRRRPGPLEVQKDEKDETMFRWMMFMDAARSWGLLQAQQQQQQQRLDSEMDPPPKYSPTGTAGSAPQEKQLTSTSVGTPALPTMLEEPPSPLSLDSPYAVPLSVPGPTKAHGYAGAHIRHRQHQSHRRRPEFVEPPIDLAQPPSSKTVVKRREKKQQDKMLYYFWIPVLLLVIAWASYKSLATLYRVVRPSQNASSPRSRSNIVDV